MVRPADQPPRDRARAFCARFGLGLPVLMAPMAGASPPALAAAVAEAGGLGACGALPLDQAGIAGWAQRFRQMSGGCFQINLWVPDDPPPRDAAQEAALADFLARFGPRPGLPPEPMLPDFDAQFAALLAARPAVASSIMGLFRPDQVAALRTAGIAWLATATTLAEALAAQEAGADAVIAQGGEAGGHRGSFTPQAAAQAAVGAMALIPALAEALDVPVIAAGAIACPRSAAAALVLGASAVMPGTVLLRCAEAGISPVWADALARARPEDSILTRAFTGRPARALRNTYILAAEAADAPVPAPYPVQRHLTEAMRRQASEAGDFGCLYALAGQAAGRGGITETPEGAGAFTRRLWRETEALLV